MNLLLDTHIFIWWSIEPDKLPQRARMLCEDAENTLVLSVASVWEMQIKSQTGKLELIRPLDEVIKDQQETNDILVLPVELTHVLALQGLPTPHKDPFDRLLIAQAIAEDFCLLSVDRVFSDYPVRLCM